jgi:hypothetical protein
MPVSIQRSWSAIRALLASLVVVGLVAFVSTPSFAASPAPTVSSVSPNIGATGGGTTVTVAGAGFTGVTGVTVGGVAATDVVAQSANQLTATVPAHTAGITDIRVAGALGTSAVVLADRYTYQSAPTITGVSRNFGSTAGGDNVTVTGTGFVGIQDVSFGLLPTGFTLVSSTELILPAPAQSARTVDIHVVTPYGTNAVSSADQYTYEGLPIVTGVAGEPAHTLAGVVAGGTVQFTGSGFLGASSVTFGGVSATGLVVNSASLLTVKAPAHVVGIVNVVVVTPVGTSDATAYTYEVLPKITSLSNNMGSAAGGGSTNVHINGSGFTDASGVLFGTVASADVTINPDSSITASIPAHAAGLVDVHVVLGDGMSAAATADHFTYIAVPAVTAVSPAAGALAGGNTVTITGSSFTSNATVKFGSTSATIVGTPTATKITVTAPASVPGGVIDVTVTGTYGTSAAATADRYTYIAPPTVSVVSPAVGVTTGGGTVTVTGTNFTGVSKVTFAGVLGTTVAVQSPTQLTVKSPEHAFGTVDVQVFTAYGSSETSASDQFSYDAVPTISSINRTQSSLAGGVPISILGANLGNVTGVMFGTVPATFFGGSPALLDVTVPPHAAGTVDITLLVGSGSSAISSVDKFTYLGSPTVTKISPTTGPVAGGTTVTVTGTNFAATSTVAVGGIAATNVHVTSTTSLTFATPAQVAGLADVVVSSFGDSPVVAADRFSYEPAPGVTGLSVTAGALGGANVVTITGTNFVGVSKVFFGTTASAKVTTSSSTKLTVTVPAHVVGVVDVTVLATYGTSATGSGDQYSYEPVPAITAVSPGAGAPAGLTSVTITGTGFFGTAKVEFATTLATNVVVVSSRQLTATIPAHVAGTVDVRVVGQYGTSPVVAADHYLYQSAGSIAGTVTGGSPVVGQAGVQVTAFTGNGDLAGTTFTSASGTYSLSGLGAGNYTLDFTPADSSYAPQWFGGATLTSAATPIALLAGQALTGKNVTLRPSGTISGFAQGTGGGSQLTDINILAYDSDDNFAGSATSSSGGQYFIFGLPAGTYTLHFVPQSGTVDAATYAPAWLGDSPAQAGSTPVVVTAGATTSGQNLALGIGGSISGTVLDGLGDGLENAVVDAYDSTGTWVGSAATSGGGYTIGGLATGTYKVKFSDPDDGLAPEWYNGVTLESHASGIAVTVGQNSFGADAVLPIESELSGTVVSSIDSSAIDGVEVSLYDADGNWAAGTVTDGSGTYALNGLAEGDYTLSFTPPTDAYAAQWWNGASSQATAGVIKVGDQAIVSNEDVSLSPTASISGTVLGSGSALGPIADATVGAFDLAGNEVATATTNTFGNYSLSGLPAGSYALDFLPGDSPFGPKWWNGASSEATASVITLTAGQNLVGTSITLTGASVSGAVTGTAGVPVSGVRVFAVDAAGNGIAQATTNGIGRYAITGIPVGSYTLEFVPSPGTDYATQWLTGKPTEAGATFISVTAGLAVSGKSVVLASTDGSISGTVTDATTTDPLEAIGIYAYDAAGNFIEEVQTDGSGGYTLAGLAAGSYEVLASGADRWATTYIDQWYGNKTTEVTATPVVVAAATAITSRDVALVANASISGTVFDGDNPGNGLFNAQVDAVNSSGAVVNSATTNGNGLYAITGLPAGTYALRFSMSDDSYAPLWSGNQSSFATATRIVVGTSSVNDAADVTMTHGASISGTISVPPPASNANAGVAVYDSTGDFAGTTSVDPSGNYQVSDLGAGTYTLDFSPNAQGPIWWYGQSAYGAQLVVTVTANQAVTAEDVQVTTAGTVSGAVTGAGDVPLGNVFVSLLDAATGSTVQEFFGTGGDGSFEFAAVPDGTYTLRFDGSRDNYVDQTSAPFSLSAGAESPIENVQLTAGASISGTVHGADDPGNGLGDIQVIAEDTNGNPVTDTSTDPDDGTYTLVGLPAGSYQLVFEPGDVGHKGTTITGISLDPAETLDNEDATLAVAGASIAGTVYGEGTPNTPITDTSIFVFDSDGDQVGTSFTDANGNYSVTDLPDGTFTIEFEPDLGSYETTWWKNGIDASSATPVTLTPGEDLSNVDPVLAQGATISGTVFTAATPNQLAAFLEVDVYDAQGNFVGTTDTNAFGSYTTDGLAPGKYTLDFTAPFGGPTSYTGQWLGGGSSETTATMITVLGAQQVAGQNAVLARAGSISGTVVDAGGLKLDGITVPIWMLVGGTYLQVTSTTTDGNGNFTLNDLGVGSYKIGFSDYASGDGSSNSVFGEQYWNAAPTLGSATPITLTAGQAATGKNATMTKISALAALTATPTPTITGTAKSGSKLTATSGTWAPATVVLTYQWERGGSVISGATSSTYTLTAADVGQQLTVVVTGQKVGYRSATKTSNPTAIVSG